MSGYCQNDDRSSSPNCFDTESSSGSSEYTTRRFNVPMHERSRGTEGSYVPIQSSSSRSTSRPPRYRPRDDDHGDEREITTIRRERHVQQIVSISTTECAIQGLSEVTFPVTSSQGVTFVVNASSNAVINVEWETFTGVIGSGGRAFLRPSQVFTHLPKKELFFPIVVTLRGVTQMGVCIVGRSKDPAYGGAAGIKMFINIDMSGAGIMMGDIVTIYGGSISWTAGEYYD